MTGQVTEATGSGANCLAAMFPPLDILRNLGGFSNVRRECSPPMPPLLEGAGCAEGGRGFDGTDAKDT